MLEQLFGLIQQHSQEAIVQNPEIPNDQNEEVMKTIMGSITSGLGQQAQSGNTQGLMNMFSGNQGISGSSMMNNPMVASIAANAIQAIMQKFGISNQAAGGIVASVLPGVLGSLVSKAKDPNDSSFDLSSILGGFLGGGSKNTSDTTTSTEAPGKSGLDLGDMLGGLFGKK